MPTKTLYIRDTLLWTDLADICARNGESVSGRLEILVSDYVRTQVADRNARVEALVELLMLTGKYTRDHALLAAYKIIG